MTSLAHPATATAATPLHPLALAAQDHRRPHQSADASNLIPLSATFPSLPLPLSSYNTNGQLAGPPGCSFKSPPQISNTSTRRHRSICRDHGQLAGPSTSGIPFEATTQVSALFTIGSRQLAGPAYPLSLSLSLRQQLQNTKCTYITRHSTPAPKMPTLGARRYSALHYTIMKYSKIKLQRATSNDGLKQNSSVQELDLVRCMFFIVWLWLSRGICFDCDGGGLT